MGMNCRKFTEVVFLYTDDEMDGELLVSFREHIELCPGCARRIDYTRRMLMTFRQRCARATAPEILRERILARLREG